MFVATTYTGVGRKIQGGYRDMVSAISTRTVAGNSVDRFKYAFASASANDDEKSQMKIDKDWRSTFIVDYVTGIILNDIVNTSP